MKPALKAFCIAAVALGVLLTLLSPSFAQTSAPTDIRKQADAAWNEKSYARALELYRKVLESKTVNDRDEIEFRVAVSLGKTEKWDDAVDAGETLVKTTPWKARVLYWLGRLYTVMPHYAWKVGDKLYRGNDYPKIAGAEQPQQVYLQAEDSQKTLDYFERAKIATRTDLEIPFFSRTIGGINPVMSLDEQIDLNFDLAAFLPTIEQPKFIEELNKAIKENRKLDETVDLSKPYNREWNLPTKVLYLYNEIAKLDNSKTKHDTALSLLAKGMFVRNYRQAMDGWANQYDEKLKKQVVREYPFDHLEAIPIFQQVVDQFPNDPIAPSTQILIAQTYQQRGDSVKALAAFQLVLTKFPKSKWVNDAKAGIQQITRKELRVDSMGQQKPGENAKLTVWSRNLKTINFSAYKIKLEDYLTQPARLNNPDITFQEFGENLGNAAAIRAKLGAPVASWKFSTKDKSDYQGTNETIDTPLKNLGAYVIIADAGSTRFGELLLISDLAILKKTDRDNSFVYIANAQSGQPEMNANVVMKEWYSTGSGESKIALGQGKTGELGFFDKKLTRGKDLYSSNVAAFAWIGDRYAMTGQSYSNYGYYGYGDNRDELKVYAYTDRPVYRPGQKVYFREIVSQRVKGGDQVPAKNIKILVSVRNPKGEEIYTKTLTSSEFGTVNGEFDLPEETPLGEYSVNVSAPDNTNAQIAASGGNRFRVEEYKRPEFTVNVDAPDRAVRPGETVAAKVNLKYYFGAPVPNAKVKYTVRRSTWWANYKFPRPFQWLWNYWGEGDYNTGRRNIGGEGSGEIVKEGETTTDHLGNAEVTFATKANDENSDPNNWWRYYSNPLYTIEIEATDASRRTIEGQGTVRVSDQQYFAFLDLQKGFYQAGDRIQVELVTQDANDKPLSASGKMVVYKLLPGNKEEQVFEETVKTDAKGRVFWNWQNDGAGQFRVAYEATDDWGKKVQASANIWVDGPNMKTTQFRQQGVTIVLENRYYKEGDMARVLLVADQPDTTVLFTQEAGGEILKREVIFIAGKTKTLSIPIRKEHVPNFSLAAAAVKNYEVYQTQQEVFVPPVKQLINVSVSGDKTEYKPGETGKFTIKATDWKGDPARAEVSLAMIDASLFYIQKSYAPDIRTFYYGERRQVSTQLDSHRSGQPQGHAEDDVKYSQYEQHGWELPDDLGMLNLQPGGFGWYGGYGRGLDLELRYGNYGGDSGGKNIKYFRAGANVMSEAASDGMVMNGAMGAPAAAPMASKALAASGDMAVAGEGGQLAEAQVRSNFAETAFWAPAVVTEKGTAQVEVKFPDSLTQWHAEARGLTNTAQVGAGESDVETKKNILVRLQAPRFFTERDQVVLSANVHNYFKTQKKIKVALKMSDQLRILSKRETNLAQSYLDTTDHWITIDAGEEKRVDWIVDVVRDGKADIQMTAQSDDESDAVKMSFPVLVHGVQRFTSQSGVLREGEKTTKQTVKINLPKERKFGATSLNVQLNPSLAATMMDALPYLMDYPYGCVEQTMSRFLPSVIVQKTLVDSGVNLSTLRERAKAYEAEAKAKPIGERVKNSGYTYPTGMANSRDLTEMSSQLWHTARRNNPIYDQKLLDEMIRDGLARLYQMQREDGGWGWWQGSGYSDEYMSGYVVYGLATAKAADVPVREDVLNRGYEYLEKQMKDEDSIHLLTWLSYSLSQRGQLSGDVEKIVSGRLYEQRERLTAYSKSLLALTL